MVKISISTLSLFLAQIASGKNIYPFPFKNIHEATSKNIRKAEAMWNMLDKATVIRKLDIDAKENELDLSEYSIKFEHCTSVKQWSYGRDNENSWNNNDGHNKLIMNKFVLFRLCPSNNYVNCDSGYGEYLISLEDYLVSTIKYFQKKQEQMCNMCKESCQQLTILNKEEDVAAVDIDCDYCANECDMIENMEDNGYKEASNFMKCQKLHQGEDDENNRQQHFAAATCSSDGSEIKIGVYEDENCTYLSNLNVDDYLNGFKLSHALLKNVYSGTEITCIENENTEAEENEVCDNLYKNAVIVGCKYDNGFSGYAKAEGNLLTTFCNHLNKYKGGNYVFDYSEIVLEGRNYGETFTNANGVESRKQKFSLYILVLSTFAIASFMLRC